MNILIIGSGYVGLVTGACLAEMGHHVICLDIDEKKIEKLKRGKIPIYEPELERIIHHNSDDQRLVFTTDYEFAVKNSLVIFLCLPSPSNPDGSCNTSYVEEGARVIATHMNSYRVIVNKSTLPMGTAFQVKKIIAQTLQDQNKNIPFDVVSNPEFLKEGSAVSDCMKPDRIVLGVDSEKALQIMREIYAPFMINQDRILIMDILSAELTKYAANAMLATRISFMNEIAEICKRYGANINKVRQGIGSDARIGHSFLYAGVGYGGSCFPKDIRALCHAAKSTGYDPLLLDAVEQINERQKKLLFHSILQYFQKKGGIKGKTIAVWGLSFKPETDDMREAPSVILIDHLLNSGAFLRLFDPISMNNAKKTFKKNLSQITWCKNEIEAASGADGIALLTEWKQFRHLDFHPILKTMKGCAIFDGRNQYHPQTMVKQGFDYIGIGVPDLLQQDNR